MHQTPSVADLVPRSELESFLKNFGTVTKRCCAVVRFPSENEIKKLIKYEKFLRPIKPETPSDLEKKEMLKELKNLKQSSFDIVHGQQTFCSLLRTSPLADLRCIYCNYINSKEAFEKKEVSCYKCHAGLIEVVVPLLAGNFHIGDLFIGQNFNEITKTELDDLHKSYESDCNKQELISAYEHLEKEYKEDDRSSIEQLKPLLQDLANFLSSYASTSLSNEIFPKLCFGVHVNTTEYHVIDQFIKGIREKYINFDSGSVWIKNKKKKGWLQCLWADYQGADKELEMLYHEGFPDNEGLGGEILSSRGNVHYETKEEIEKIDPPKNYEKLRTGRNMRTFLGVPLKFDNDISGFFEIGSQNEHAFDVSTIRMIEEAARYLSLYFSLKSDMKTMISYLLSRNKDETFLQMAVQSIPEIIGAFACSIFRLSKDGNRLTCVATTGIVEKKDDIPLKEISYSVDDNSLTSYVFRNDKKELVPSRKDINKDLNIGGPRYHEIITTPSGHQLDPKEYSEISVIMIPLKNENNDKVGVLRIVGKTDFTAFSEADVNTAESFSEVLLSNPVSYMNVFKVGMEMLNRNDMDTIAYQFLTLITHKDGIGIHRAMVFSFDQEQSKLEKIMGIGPLNKNEADSMGRYLVTETSDPDELDKHITNTIQGINEINQSNLYTQLPNSISVDERLWRYIRNDYESVKMDTYEISAQPVCEFEKILQKMDMKSPLLTILPLNAEKKFVLVCDTIYGTSTEITDQQKRQLKVACDFFIHAEEIRSTVGNELSARKEWWVQAEKILRHNLGNNLTVLENVITTIYNKIGDKKTLTAADCGIFSFDKSEGKNIKGNLLLELIWMAKRNISNISKFEIKLIKEKVQLSTFKSELQHHLRYAGMAPWRINVYWDFKDKDDVILEIDYERIFDCFDNLIKNVAECEYDDRKVTVSCMVLDADDHNLPKELIQKNNGKYVIFGVKDNGPGIREEDRHQLFKPYHSTKKGEHSGLGLAFIAHVMQNHGGVVYEDGNHLQQGAHFNMCFPVVKKNEGFNTSVAPLRQDTLHESFATFSDANEIYGKENEKLLKKTSSNRKGLPWKMLIVEDDPLILNNILKKFIDEKMLNRTFFIKSATNVKEYLAQQKNMLFDIIILDLKLFDYGAECDSDGGLNISKYSQILNAGVVTILFSASLTVRDSVEAMRRGVWDCIDKNEKKSMELLKKSILEGIEAKIGTSEWIEKSMRELPLEEYQGKYVALVNGTVEASSSSIRELKKRVMKKIHSKATDSEIESETHDDNIIQYVQVHGEEVGV